MRSQRGQATVEWTAAVLVVALTLGAAIAFVPLIDGRSFGSWLARQILCGLRGGCGDGGDDLLARSYGPRDGALVRRYAPNIVYEPGTYTLPVDFRTCRSHRCSDAPDDPELDVAASNRGTPAAVFTHVVHRGGETFLQYWFYYPDSNSVIGPSSAIWNNSPARAVAPYPGWHLDDWEGYQVRIAADGRASVRATSHHGYQGCKETQCHNRWIAWTGWTRVSKGSHAGHIPYETQWQVEPARRRGPAQRHVTGYRPLLPGRDLHERTTSAAALALIPIESLPGPVLGTDFGSIAAPWRKEVYRDPLSNSTD
jgi:hypothetical protein